MTLTAQQLAYLKSAVSRYVCHLTVFPAYTPTIDLSKVVAGHVSGTTLAPRPMPMVHPRYSTLANSATISLIATNSYNPHGAGYVGNANVAWALNAGSSGTLVDNGDGTATYTAPAAGNGIAQINMTATNASGSKVGHAYVHYSRDQYNEVFSEITSLSASVAEHGWKMTIRARGDVSDFTLYKTVLLAVRDSWADTGAYTESTFGGYNWSPGVFVGVITKRSYFLDGEGIEWVGLEIQSPFWWLNQLKMGETFWGYTAEGGKFTYASFRPIDALWHYLNEVTNYSAEYDVVLWDSQNVVDDLVIEESDLGTIVEDVIARTLGITFTDRYGSLFCVPDPDVLADEWDYGTQPSMFVVSDDLVLDYTIHDNKDYVKKLTMEAIDRSMLGIYAISDNTSAVTGSVERYPGRLICDQAITLASWVVQKRAQMNRPWFVDISVPLNHTLDIGDFVDVILTSPRQSGGLTASAQCWVSTIAYRPDLLQGTWEGRITLLPRTDGLGESETGAVSSWGGTGSHVSARSPYSGSSRRGSGTGGWGNASGGGSAWCRVFNFQNSATEGWAKYAGAEAYTNPPDSTHVVGLGWSGTMSQNCQSYTGAHVDIYRSFPARALTHVTLFYYFPETATELNAVFYGNDPGTTATCLWRWTALAFSFPTASGSGSAHGTINFTASQIRLRAVSQQGSASKASPILLSARLCGKGTDPFAGGTGNDPLPI